MDEPLRNAMRTPGGSVEPLDRGFVVKEALPIQEVAAERFELHDPRSDLTYRRKTFVEMATKANQLGASRFVAIASDGSRSTVSKIGGRWQRDDRSHYLPTPIHKEAQATAPGPVDAARAARIVDIEAALHERYLIRRAPIRIGDVFIGQTEYRHRGDPSRIAFTESAFRLSTDNNSPSVARSMVDVAEARGWQALRVSGNDDFKRMVWLEASLRDVRTIGYEAVPGDRELLAKEREARQLNRIEPLAPAVNSASPVLPAKQSERGGGGRKAVLAALEAVLVAKNVAERQRQAVMAAAAENLAIRVRNGETHRVKVYDKAAPSQQPVRTPAREVQRERERGAPSR
jgi:hypothetical protein